MSNREIDANGFIHIKKNPISKVGVFPYLGKNIDAALDPNKIYWVYRPAEELARPEFMNSLKNLPVIDDHTMIGRGATPAEHKGVAGVTGGDVTQEGDFLYADLHIYSDTLKRKIDQSDKKELSMGYRVGRYEKANGTFNGKAYDFIQRDLKANHVALVKEGRMGKEVAVLDHGVVFDGMDITEDMLAEDAGTKSHWQGEAERLQNQLDQLESGPKNPTTQARLKAVREQYQKCLWNIAQAKDSTDKLEPGSSKETISHNIETEINAGKDPKQAAAIAYSEAGESKAKDENMTEEEKKKEAADKMAKDAAEKEGEQKLAKDKKAKDEKEEEEKKKAEDKKAMDKKAKDEDEMKDKEKKEAKDATDAAISGLRQELSDFKKNGMKILRQELAKRDDLIADVSKQFGTFATDAMDSGAEVAAYGLKKAGIEAPAGSEVAVWEAYSKGLGARRSTVALDSKEIKPPVGSLIEKTLAASK